MAHFSIRVFGIFRDIVEADHVNIDMDTSLTLGEVKQKFEEQFPNVKNVHYMTAINQEYCRDNEKVLTEQDEIAFLPPVAGG